MMQTHPDTQVQICRLIDYCSETKVMYHKQVIQQRAGSVSQKNPDSCSGIDSDSKYSNVHLYCDVENGDGNSTGYILANPENYVRYIESGSCME